MRASASTVASGWLAVLLVLGSVTSSRAQDVATSNQPPADSDVAGPAFHSLREPRLELTVLGGVLGGGSLGDRSADALGNQAPTSPSSTWFSTRARIDAAPVVEGRVGLRAFGRFWVEGGLSYARPEFVVDISQDVEGAPNTTATSQLTQVLVDGSVQYRWAGRRVSPFVLGGGGYVRQLDDTRSTAETGWLGQAGGGLVVRVAPESRGFARRIALRGDVRVVWLRDAVILEAQRGATFSALAGVTIGL